FADGTWVAPQAADSGSIVSLVGDGRIAILGSNLNLKRVFTPVSRASILRCGWNDAAPPAGYVGLRRNRLAFISQGRSLDVYDTITGNLVHSYPVPAAASNCSAHVDLYYGYAVYAVGRALHVLKLATGSDRVVATLSHPSDREFQLDAPGLVYVT